MLGAVLEASVCCKRVQGGKAEWHAVMDSIAIASRNSFRQLVYATPEFESYHRSATPIDVIEKLNIGSRPVSRKASHRIEDMRAIPWVFSFTQNRQLLPGWYGMGSGLEHACQQHGVDTLVEMAHEWPFFATLLSDLEMVLAKTDMEIGALYAELAGPSGQAVAAEIMREHTLTQGMVLQLQGHDMLLQNDEALRRALRLRDPYIDPMSLLQIDLLQRWRNSGRADVEIERALIDTVMGIARGMQNTG
jgi:phosphoenolpyruvate carboxylase